MGKQNVILHTGVILMMEASCSNTEGVFRIDFDVRSDVSRLLLHGAVPVRMYFGALAHASVVKTYACSKQSIVAVAKIWMPETP